MKRRKFCAALPVAIAAIAPQTAQTTQPRTVETQSKSKSEEEKEIQSLEKKLAAAAERGDAAATAQHLAPTFFAIDASGAELSAADVLARTKQEGYRVESLRHENIRVRVTGDTAVVTAHTELRASFQGKDVSGKYPYLRVWQRQANGWRALVTAGLPNR